MCPVAPGAFLRATRGLLPALILALLLASCGSRGEATPTPQVQQRITIETPTDGMALSSPAALRGSATRYPTTGQLTYRVFDGNNNRVGAGPVPIQGNQGGPVTFATQFSFVVTTSSVGRLEVIDLNAASGEADAVTAIRITLVAPGQPVPTSAATSVPGGPTATPAVVTATPGAPTAVVPTQVSQGIVFDSPPAGTVVGSPVTITGRTTIFPATGQLLFRVRDQANNQIGGGSFPVVGNGGGSSFNTSISFNPPASGGPIFVDVLDGGTASATLQLFVAPPQQITITSPAPNQFVGSPMVITGQLARLPFDSSLAYQITSYQGAVLGSGVFPVSGQDGRPTTFNASLTFDVPLDGGPIRVTLTDQRASDGLIAATASIGLQVAAQAQQIFIDTPPEGTQVGSPVVLTGRTVRYPQGGILTYFVYANGSVAGTGTFPVTGAPNTGTSFSASLTFVTTPSTFSGPIRVELRDQALASTSINLQVGPPMQQIIIATPPNGTLVGSPVVVTGSTTRLPFENNLSYRIRDATGAQIGSGGIPVTPTSDGGSTWVGSLPFQLTANSGTTITVEVYDQDAASGGTIAIAAVTLIVQPISR